MHFVKLPHRTYEYFLIQVLNCSDLLISHRNSRSTGQHVGPECLFFMALISSKNKKSLLFSHSPVSARPSWCPGYCAESQIIAPLLLLLKRLSPLICSGGLQFFFSNAISFSRDGMAPNDPKSLLFFFPSSDKFLCRRLNKKPCYLFIRYPKIKRKLKLN